MCLLEFEQRLQNCGTSLEAFRQNYPPDRGDFATFINDRNWSNALDRAFGWGSTPEGFSFWSHVYDGINPRQIVENEL